MGNKTEIVKNQQPLHVLLIGNNPIDMSRVLDKLNQIRGTRIITEIAFDLKSLLERLMNFQPNFIVIDDNIGRSELTQAVETLAHSRKTKHVPITVLKNSNYSESYASAAIQEYLLKTNVSADSLYKTLKNSLRLRRTQEFLYSAFRKRKKLFSKRLA